VRAARGARTLDNRSGEDGDGDAAAPAARAMEAAVPAASEARGSEWVHRVADGGEIPSTEGDGEEFLVH
jgi:hypothetical protein